MKYLELSLKVSMENDKKELFEKQKEMLDQFLKTGAIDKGQYEKSLNGLKEKMSIKDERKD